jgi:hypothetical protein
VRQIQLVKRPPVHRPVDPDLRSRFGRRCRSWPDPPLRAPSGRAARNDQGEVSAVAQTLTKTQHYVCWECDFESDGRDMEAHKAGSGHRAVGRLGARRSW